MMTTATASKPEVETKSKERSTSPVNNESCQKSPADSIPQTTDPSQMDRVSESEPKRFPRIREHDDRKIFVGNLPVHTNADELIEHFSQAGPIEYATVIKSRDGFPRRYGFIVFTNKEDSVKAVETLNNLPFGESVLVVQSIVPRPRRPRRRSPRMYSSRRESARRGPSFDRGARQHMEGGAEEDEDQRNTSRPYVGRSYRSFRSSGRRNRYYSSQHRQEADDGAPNTQGTQTQDSQPDVGSIVRERSQSYGRRRRSARRPRRSYGRRPRGEDSRYVSDYSSSSQSEEYNGGRVSPRGDEPREQRGHYSSSSSSSQEYGYRSGQRNYRTSEERGPFLRRSGPHQSEYRSRAPRNYYGSQQHYGGVRHSAPMEEQYSKVGVFVGNLPYHVAKESLADFFSEKGYSVRDAYVVRDANKKSKGYGFVEFETNDDQSKAIRQLDGVEMYDRLIAIKPAVVSQRVSKAFGDQQREE